MLKALIQHRHLIFELLVVELKRRNAGTALWPIWLVLPSIMTIAAFWFVFEVGLRIQSAPGISYFFYFTLGILPWFLFFDSFSTNVRTVIDNRHLITKMVFPSEILPVINLLVASIPHLFLIVCVALGLAYDGRLIGSRLPWIVYFYGCTLFLALGISWLISAICVFVKDAAPASTLAIGLLFWMTPIVWHINAVPIEYQWIFSWNPLTYLAEGYRWSMTDIGSIELIAHLRFWSISTMLMVTGAYVFNRLKLHFADVL